MPEGPFLESFKVQLPGLGSLELGVSVEQPGTVCLPAVGSQEYRPRWSLEGGEGLLRARDPRKTQHGDV